MNAIRGSHVTAIAFKEDWPTEKKKRSAEKRGASRSNVRRPSRRAARTSRQTRWLTTGRPECPRRRPLQGSSWRHARRRHWPRRMQWPPRRSTTPSRRRPHRFSSHASTTFAPRVSQVVFTCVLRAYFLFLRPANDSCYAIKRESTREASLLHHSRAES
jgi:hypothetical protein